MATDRGSKLCIWLVTSGFACRISGCFAEYIILISEGNPVIPTEDSQDYILRTPCLNTGPEIGSRDTRMSFNVWFSVAQLETRYASRILLIARVVVPICLKGAHTSEVSNVVVEWLTLLLRIRDVPCSILAPATGFHDWGFS
jgi:hypothetical protein